MITDLDVLADSVFEQLDTRCINIDISEEAARTLAIQLIRAGMKQGIDATIVAKLATPNLPLVGLATAERVVLLEAMLESLIEHACSHVVITEHYVQGGHKAVSQGPIPNTTAFKGLLAAVEKSMRASAPLPN